MIGCEVDGVDRVLVKDTVVSMNIWGFLPSYFYHAEQAFKAFLDERIDEPKSELYIPKVVDDLIEAKTLNVRVLQNDSSWFGVTYQEDKPHVSNQINKLIEDGTYPVNLWT